MKKVLFILLMMFLCFSFVACNEIEVGEDPIDDPTVDPVKDPVEEKIDSILASMTIKQKIYQMIMMACRSRDGVNLTEMKDEVVKVIKESGFAGMILFAHNCVENEQVFNLIKDMQEANKEGGNPGLFVALDQEGGRVVRLEEGTTTLGNMALGAINSKDDTKTIASLIASEVSSLGFNVDFAPVVDINNNPNNPVIGVRSFSDDKNIVSQMTKSFVEGLKENNVIGSLKHFPGHGDTSTDSHTGLPLIDKSLEQLLDFELVPYSDNLNDIEMIMTAHIVYPQIEKGTYKSISTGEEINLPATLSKTIITDVLREQLGYEGIVVTDALEMDAIASHFDRLDVARLSINAGVDILLMPVDISTENGIDDLKQYVDDVANLVEEEKIDIEKIDASVKRILKLKEKYNLLEGYPEMNINNISNVGSKEHHDIEWEITKKAITLLKNNGNTLPITKNDKVLFLTTDSTQTTSIEYSLALTERDGTIDNVERILDEEYKIDFYDKVVIISSMTNNKYYNTGLAETIDNVIKRVQDEGKKVILLSTNLPYDASRFKEADAIVLCYSPKPMSISPLETTGQIKQYGPNIPCAIYMMLNDSTYTGKVPVIIYELNENYELTSNILFNRGWGLEK